MLSLAGQRHQAAKRWLSDTKILFEGGGSQQGPCRCQPFNRFIILSQFLSSRYASLLLHSLTHNIAPYSLIFRIAGDVPLMLLTAMTLLFCLPCARYFLLMYVLLCRHVSPIVFFSAAD